MAIKKFRGVNITTEIIYVKLLGEELEVWKPVNAVMVDSGLYHIIDEDICVTEVWQFKPGTVVRAEPRENEGDVLLFAVAEYTRTF